MLADDTVARQEQKPSVKIGSIALESRVTASQQPKRHIQILIIADGRFLLG